jgi:1,4-alpha-glucan branching enzyme
MPAPPLDTAAVLELDGYLKPDINNIEHRYNEYRKWKDTIDEHEGGYESFTKGYLKFGLNVGKNGEVEYREWAPNATEAYLIGDFSNSSSRRSRGFLPSNNPIDNWNRTSHPMKKDNWGVWEITVPPTPEGVCAIPHDSKLKVCTSILFVIE